MDSKVAVGIQLLRQEAMGISNREIGGNLMMGFGR